MEYKISESSTKNGNGVQVKNFKEQRKTHGQGGERDWLVTLSIVYDLVFLLSFMLYTVLATPVKYLLNRNKLKALDNQIILVTGAASGIGREICLQLAKIDRSITLICWDVSQTQNDDLVRECKKLGLLRAFSFTVDVGDREQVEAAAQKIKTEIGDVRVLFNNAGVSGDARPLWEQDPKSIEKVLQVNLLSSFWTLQAFLPGMMEQGKGHIVTTCSVLGQTQIKHLSPYVASKFGVTSMIETLKLDLACDPRKPDIKFTTVYPNLTLTPMVANFKKTAKYDFLLKGVSPGSVARRIIAGMRQDVEHVYPHSINRFMPLFVATTPAAVFRKIHQIFHYESKRVN